MRRNRGKIATIGTLAFGLWLGVAANVAALEEWSEVGFLFPVYIANQKKSRPYGPRGVRRATRAVKSRVVPKARYYGMEAKLAWGIATQRMRALPDFLIIGAQRAGTTSLYNYLIKHPCVRPALKKEIHYFDLNFSKGLRWYKGHFFCKWQPSQSKGGCGHKMITGEGTPYYIFHPHAPYRIVHTLPQVKLIGLLRNPVDRAYSHYIHHLRLGAETLSFEEAIINEASRLEGETENVMRQDNYHSLNHQYYSYLSRGIYSDQMERWLTLFPKDQLLIIGAEDLKEQTNKFYRQILEFLELPVFDLGHYTTYNRRQYPQMAPATRQRLVRFFAPHNQRLYRLLGKTFDWDK